MRACVRSCAGACERCSSTLEAPMARSAPALVSPFVFFCVFDDSYMGFKVFFLGSMLYAWAF